MLLKNLFGEFLISKNKSLGVVNLLASPCSLCEFHTDRWLETKITGSLQIWFSWRQCLLSSKFRLVFRFQCILMTRKFRNWTIWLADRFANAFNYKWIGSGLRILTYDLLLKPIKPSLSNRQTVRELPGNQARILVLSCSELFRSCRCICGFQTLKTKKVYTGILMKFDE